MLHFCCFLRYAFSYYSHVHCAQFSVCLIACSCAFLLYMCIIPLALFFSMVLHVVSSISVTILFTFVYFVFCRFFSVPLPRFTQFPSIATRFFLRFRLDKGIKPTTMCRLMRLLHFFVVFLLGFVLAFLPYENQWVV